MSVRVPIPASFAETVFMALGFTFGRAFGKQLDQNVQSSDWFGQQSKLMQWFLQRLLDFLHHWWMGALIMIYCTTPELYWFGAGLFIDDLPDIPPRFQKIFAGYIDWRTGENPSHENDKNNGGINE